MAARLTWLWLAISLLVGGCTVSRLTWLNLGQLFVPTRKLAGRIVDPRVPGTRLSVLWVGHATVLLQLGERFVLTDPVLTTSVGQLSKRLVEPGIDPANLPTLDAVLISHMHFDHLSQGSLQKIESRVRRLFVPRQGSVYLPGFGFAVQELGPYQRFEADGLEVFGAPVAHDASRYRHDAHWLKHSAGAYVVRHGGVTVYFGGDADFRPENYRQVAARYGPIDLAILPIAPIEPHAHMGARHMDPAEAVRAWDLLGARHMLPVHYDTFVNSFDRVGDALRLLDAALAARPGGRRGLVQLAIGERRELLGSSRATPPATHRGPAPRPDPG